MKTIGFLVCFAATATSADPVIQPDKPNEIAFPAGEARFVRLVIHGASASQPCIDELEVYDVDGRNVALAAHGAKASASSCLAGHAIHRIEHLNDGQYGNDHSWIAAGTTGEWAQIELPRATKVDKVVFSRDREGQYRDRVPVHFEIRISLDGQQWKSVRTVRPSKESTRTESSDFVIPTPSAVGPLDTSQATVSEALKRDDLILYAFLCEARTCAKIDASDPTARVLKQLSEMIGRFATVTYGNTGLDVSRERGEFAKLSDRYAVLATQGTPDVTANRRLFFAARMAKRRLFFREPELEGIQDVLFVERHPFLPSHNYSVILDAQGAMGGAICRLKTPWRDGRLLAEQSEVKRLFESGEGVARDPMADFAAEKIYFGYRDSPAAYFDILVMNTDGSRLKRLTEGPFHDYYPCPLPDGGLAFVSTRCRARSMLLAPRMPANGKLGKSSRKTRGMSGTSAHTPPAVIAAGR